MYSNSDELLRAGEIRTLRSQMEQVLKNEEVWASQLPPHKAWASGALVTFTRRRNSILASGSRALLLKSDHTDA